MWEDEPIPKYYIGLDLGQSKDFTAVSVIRRRHGADLYPPSEPYFELIYLRRVPLGTPYPKIIEGISRMLAQPEFTAQVMTSQGVEARPYPQYGAPMVALVVDATGVGRPVIDHMKKEGLQPIAISITGGEKVNGSGNEYHVPKREIVHNLLILLQTNRLTIARKLQEYDQLLREMQNFKVKISKDGHDSYEAWREGEHDDMVLSVALACWYAEYTHPKIEVETDDRDQEDLVLVGGGGYH